MRLHNKMDEKTKVKRDQNVKPCIKKFTDVGKNNMTRKFKVKKAFRNGQKKMQQNSITIWINASIYLDNKKAVINEKKTFVRGQVVIVTRQDKIYVIIQLN